MSNQVIDQPEQSQIILLKKKVFDLTHELQLTKLQNENLVSEIVELKEKENKLKQVNDMLVENLKTSEKQVPFSFIKINDQITLNINGEFLAKRIHELEEQLEKYRSGVSDSVDRRVKKIVNQYTQEKQLEFQKRKSRLSLGNGNKAQDRQYYETHEHKYYNIEYKTFTEPRSRTESKENSISTIPHRQKSSNVCSEQDSICQEYEISINTKTKDNLNNKIICEKCFELQEILNQKEEVIHKLHQKFRCMLAQLQQNKHVQPLSPKANQETEEWKLKYLQLLKLYQNLKQQHDLCQNYANDLPNKSPTETYTITQSPINGFKKKQLFTVNSNAPFNSNPCESRFYNEPKDREEEMLQEITNLVNGLGRGKKPNPKEISQAQYQQSQYQKQQQNYINEKKSRVSYTGDNSRLSQQQKLDGSQFTIKQGVNRYGNRNGLF